jgi:hypothetical protein
MTEHTDYLTHKIMFKCNINTNENYLFLVYLEKLSLSQNITASKLIPVATRPKALVFGHSLAQIAGSNPTWVTDICFF